MSFWTTVFGETGKWILKRFSEKTIFGENGKRILKRFSEKTVFGENGKQILKRFSEKTVFGENGRRTQAYLMNSENQQQTSAKTANTVMDISFLFRITFKISFIAVLREIPMKANLY